jgi:hypothetical protein
MLVKLDEDLVCLWFDNSKIGKNVKKGLTCI